MNIADQELAVAYIAEITKGLAQLGEIDSVHDRITFRLEKTQTHIRSKTGKLKAVSYIPRMVQNISKVLGLRPVTYPLAGCVEIQWTLPGERRITVHNFWDSGSFITLQQFTMPKVKKTKVKIGAKVKWRAAGKVALLEGTHGKVCTGIVQSVGAGTVTILPDHRTKEGATMFGMRASVAIADLMEVK